MIQAKHVEFAFARDWQHAGVVYQAGDRTRLAEATASMLATMGAGAVALPARTKTRAKTSNPSADSGGNHSNNED